MIKAFLKKITLSLMTITMLLSSASTCAGAVNQKYISDVILSYGDTDDEAKQWLKDNDYEVLDYNLNEGAEDNKYISLGKSKKRSVYLGYKTTTDASKAITDMKLMNMKGGYSIQDYQELLENQKSSIKTFISSFIDTLKEYRINYNNTNKTSPAHLRAVAAHDTLNMFVDDDTGMNMGDLLLNDIKEECNNYDNMSESEKKKHADMTTILMQGNSEIVSTIEQTLASACDTSDTLWLERYNSAQTYDGMLDALTENGKMSVEEAEGYLDKKYEDTANTLAILASGYKTWLSEYLDSGLTIDSSEDKLNAYFEKKSDNEIALWLAQATEYSVLKSKQLSEEDSTLYEILTTDYSKKDSDLTLLYPLASVLSEGQKACLSFLTCNQLVEMGFNMGDQIQSVVEDAGIDKEKGTTSVYTGVDRSLYIEKVALTNAAYQLQTTNEDKDYTDNWITGGTSKLTKILALSTAVSTVSLVATLIETSYMKNATQVAKVKYSQAKETYDYTVNEMTQSLLTNQEEEGTMILNKSFSTQTLLRSEDDQVEAAEQLYRSFYDNYKITEKDYVKSLYADSTAPIDESVKPSKLTSYCYYADIALTFATIALSVATIWSAYKDLKKYYDVDFTPIPGYMVDEKTQTVNGKDTEVFTYYKAVKCNRSSNSKFETKNSEFLGDYGDLNGDVGKQWVALYTTKDKAAGSPIGCYFKVHYNNTYLALDYEPLTQFGSGSIENLTNEKDGYTYANKKNGIYLSYYVPEQSSTTGTAMTYGVVALGAGAVVIGVVIYLKKKKKKVQA